jgi:tetratricopeptide (TPR) repeat protein
VSDNIFDHFFPKVPQENTDDHPILEFMVVRDFQLGKMGSDSFLKRQALLNIQPVGQNDLNDPARLARKTGVFYKFGSGYFKQNFVPILKRNPYHMAVFLVWSAEYLADKSKPDEAIGLLKKACEITSYNYSESIDNLAQAYAAGGRFAEALATVEKALQQAKSSGQIDKTRHFQKQLQHYKSRAVEQE